MFSISFKYFSSSEILLGVRLVKNRTMDQEGTPGPNHYQFQIGILFSSLHIEFARFTNNHL